MAALPTAQNVFLFASRYGRGMTVARDVILCTTLLSVGALVECRRAARCGVAGSIVTVRMITGQWLSGTWLIALT